MTGVLPKNIRRCAHRKTNGIPCGSPALKDKPYCYFHDRWREQHIEVIDGTPYYQNAFCELPVLEDANAIQMALSKVFHMLLAGLLDPKFAKSLIYCLSIAAQNLRYCNFAPKDEDLGDNTPAREDQSIPQNMLESADRPEGSERWQMERDQQDAAILAKQLAETEKSNEETVEIQAMAQEDVREEEPTVPHVRVRSVDANVRSDPSVYHTDCHPERVFEEPAVSPDGKEKIVDLMAMRRLGSNPSSRRRSKKVRTVNDLHHQEPKKKPKPIVNLFDHLAQRREDYKKREGIV